MSDKKSKHNSNNLDAERVMACVEVGKLLTSTLNLKEILELIMNKISHLIDAQNWSLLLKDRTTDELVFEIVEGTNKDTLIGLRIAPGDGIASQVAETGIPAFLENVKESSKFTGKVDTISGFTTETIICIPLTIYGNILGVIEIINVRDMELFRIRDLPILTILADYAAIAIENSHHFAKIHQMSLTDEYTGLYNARYLHQILEDLIHEGDKNKKTLAVVFVDIDNFKNVVDTYGHLSGTLLLKEIGETMSSCLSERDILIKYGGDEYVIIYTETDKETAINRTKKILHSLRESTYLKNESEPVKITASFGIAAYPDDARTKKELLILADNSMYRIKKSSKNDVGSV
jgi:diguanylate cyclase (GGDEF)-like protein